MRGLTEEEERKSEGNTEEYFLDEVGYRYNQMSVEMVDKALLEEKNIVVQEFSMKLKAWEDDKTQLQVMDSLRKEQVVSCSDFANKYSIL